MQNNTPKEHVHDPRTLIVIDGHQFCMDCPGAQVLIKEISLQEVALFRDFQNEFRKIYYEPEHEDGETCWCKPRCWVDNGQYRIDHHEQRKILQNLFWEFMLKYSALKDEL